MKKITKSKIFPILSKKNKSLVAVKKKIANINSRQIYITAFAVGLLALAYLYRGQFIIATVNGQPIWRTQLIAELEKQAGKNAADSIITKQLVLQEAKKKKVVVNDNDVNNEIKKIEEELTAQGQNLDSLLAFQGMTRQDLTEQIKLQLIAEKMVPPAEVTDKEVDDYLASNENLIPKGQTAQDVKPGIKERLLQQKQNQEIQTWLSGLKENAKINYWLPILKAD